MNSPRTLLLAFLLIPFFNFSQVKLSDDFKVTAGTPYDVIDAGSKEYVSLDNGYAILAKMGKREVHLQKYDVNNMKEVARNEYDDLPKKAYFMEIIKLGDRLFYLYQNYNRKGKNYQVFSREINTEDATFKEPKLLFETSRKVEDQPRTGELTEEIVGNPFGAVYNVKFPISISFDESKVLIYYRCEPESTNDEKNYDLIGIHVFDQNMEKVHGNEVKMPYTEAQINNVGYAVCSSGEAKIIIANRETKNYEVFTIDNSGELKVKELDLSTEDMVRNLKVREDEEGNLMCGGLYTNGIEFKMSFTGSAFTYNIDGLLYFELDKNNKLVKNEKYPFSIEFIKQNLNERLKKNVEEREADGKAGILDLFLLDVIVKEDGSSYYICERQWKRNEFYGMSQTMVYHFGNAVIIKLDPDGNLAWMKKLPKNQAGTNGGGQMSIAYLEGQGSDYVAFIDNPKNIDLDADGGIPEAHKDGLGGFLTTYKIDHETGDLEKHTIADIKDINGQEAHQFKVWRIFRVGKGKFLMEGYIKGKEDNMFKFELK